MKPITTYRRFERHATCCDLLFARVKAGNSSEARMPMMAMTTSNSINVKARARMAVQFNATTQAAAPFNNSSVAVDCAVTGEQAMKMISAGLIGSCRDFGDGSCIHFLLP